MHRSNRGDYRKRSRSRSRSRSRHRGGGGGGMARYGPAPSSRDDRRFRDDRDYGRTSSRYEDRSRDRRNQNYSSSANNNNYPYDRYNDHHRRAGRSRSNRRRNRQRSTSRETYRRSRRMGRGGRSASTDYGGYDHPSRKSSYVETKRDMSDDSTSHDDTIGSYDGVPGDIIDKRYEILRDAGLGTFGRVLLCKDLESESKDVVALKVVRKVEKYSDSAKIEANILKHVNEKDVNGDSLCVRMHRWFEFQGHVILVFEQLGCSLYDYLKKQNYKPFPLDSIRAYAWQLLTSLKFLHQVNLIHTDLKPENILLVHDAECTGDRAKECQRKGNLVPPAQDLVKLIDFGGATYDDESKSGIINTRQYRSPEVMLGLGWSFPSDIWSAACIIAELYIGELLFVTHENLEHLALIDKCIGSFPAEMVSNADRQAQKYFTADRVLNWPQGAATRESVDHVRKMKSLEEIIDGDDAQDLLDLLTRMLAMDPKDRITAVDALQHPFFTGVSLKSLHG